MLSNTKTKTTTAAASQNSISRGAIYTGTGIAGLISLWAGACLFSALISTGPIGLISSWFSAISGL